MVFVKDKFLVQGYLEDREVPVLSAAASKVQICCLGFPCVRLTPSTQAEFMLPLSKALQSLCCLFQKCWFHHKLSLFHTHTRPGHVTVSKCTCSHRNGGSLDSSKPVIPWGGGSGQGSTGSSTVLHIADGHACKQLLSFILQKVILTLEWGIVTLKQVIL